MDELIALRHELHSTAELSGQEKKTAQRIEKFLKTTNPTDIITGVGGEGIIAHYKSNKPGPSVMLRCELDALPIPEENDVPYKSENKNTGHKCGHDGHMAIICGVARQLRNTGIEKGEVLLLFQPSEETGQGAQRILKDESFKDINPDFVFALHNLPGYEKHEIITRRDTFAAASIGFIAKLKGQTSHAAHPEEGKSPAFAQAQLINVFSSLSQFYTPLARSAKVTVIHSKLGERAFGTSPGYAEIMATLRTYDDETLEVLKEKVLEITEGTASTFGLELETEWVESFAATINDDEAVSIIESVAHQRGFKNSNKEKPFGWSEDFGHFTKEFKGALFGLGSGRDQPALHAGNYDFPDDIIPTGVDMFYGIIDQILNE